MRKALCVLVSICVLCAPMTAWAHSGGTDENGCHGGSEPFHCHDEGGSGSGGEGLSDGATIALGLVVLAGIIGVGVWMASASSPRTPTTSEPEKKPEAPKDDPKKAPPSKDVPSGPLIHVDAWGSTEAGGVVFGFRW